MKVTIRVHPNAKEVKVEKDLLGRLHVYVIEPAYENRANHAVLKALAKYYGSAKSQVTIISGGNSRNKIIEIKTS